MSTFVKHLADRKKHSLLSRNARTQFVVSLVLISVIPVLTLLYLVLADETRGGAMMTIVAFLILLVALGYILLIKYPVTILRLRGYLEGVVKTEAPDKAESVESEDDISAIGKYLDIIVADTKAKLVTIKSQQNLLIAAEQHRVMIQSLGAACHHLGQPATVLVTYMEMLNRTKGRDQSPEAAKMIAECLAASRDIQNVLERLKSVSEYRTEPYLPESVGTDQILKV